MRFEIFDEPGFVASIDVLEVGPARRGRLVALCESLVAAALEDTDFLSGAVHSSLPALSQPLVWLGAVPLHKRFVAIYARWRADGHQRAFSDIPACTGILAAMSEISRQAEAMAQTPKSSLYAPFLMDARATDGTAPTEGRRGPIVDDVAPTPCFINVFDTTPDRQDALVEETRRILPIVQAHEGYVSTGLHRSLDGFKVANYGQYRNFGQVRSMYFYKRTAIAFGAILFKDLTRPTWAKWKGRPIGIWPAIRCYKVTNVVERNALS